MTELLRFFAETLETAVPLFLLFGSLFLLFRLSFVLLRAKKRRKQNCRGSAREKRSKRRMKRDASPLRALMMALAGTLGVGNITGVALAIATAGAGALFWMWVSAAFAMVLKYAEVVLALSFRPKSEKERVGGSAGGAMYYMQNGIGGKGGSALAALFAVLCLLAAFSIGGAVQSNAVAEALYDGFSVPPLLCGLLLALLTAFCVFRGAEGIEKATLRLVPIAACLYLGMMAAVIFRNFALVDDAFLRIFQDAFTWKSATGGILGFLTSRALRAGVSGGLLSNEAGAGSAPMAHIRAEHVTPARQGLYGILEVAIDTFLICTVTAVGILVACPELAVGEGTGSLAYLAIASVFGKAAPFLYSASIAVFAFATILCWSYYGENCILWFAKGQKSVQLYRIFFCLSLFFGAILSISSVFDITDIILAAMTWLNVTAVLLLSRQVAKETEQLLLP